MRRIATYVVADKNRDHGKTFRITEMPADQGERWATQALKLMAEAGKSIPNGALEAGMAGLAAAGVDVEADTAAVGLAVAAALQDPSLDALWDCVQYIHDPAHPPQPLYVGENCQIEEIKTRRDLRMEVLKLHLNPSKGAESQSSVPAKRRRV